MRTTKLRWSTDMEGTWLCALVPREEALFALENFEEGKEYNLEVKKARGRKRSLDANAYCWVLMDKLADITGTRSRRSTATSSRKSAAIRTSSA